MLIITSTGYGFIAGLIPTLSRRSLDKLTRPRAQGMGIFLTPRCCVVTYAFHQSLLHRILSPFHYIHITLRYQALRYVIAVSNAVCNKFQSYLNHTAGTTYNNHTIYKLLHSTRYITSSRHIDIFFQILLYATF